MKIAFVTLGFNPLRLSGLDVSGERLVEGLLAEGHDVTVIAGQKQPFEEVVNHQALEIRRIPIGSSDWIGFSQRAGRLINRLDDFDIVHFWDIHFAYACRRPYVGSIHHSYLQRLQSLSFERGILDYLKMWLYYQLARRLAEIPAINRSTGLLAGSVTTRQEFITEYGISQSKIALARHGINVNFFSPVDDLAKLRSRVGVPPNQPVLLFAGFITPRKGVEYLVEALADIEPKPILLLAGRWRSEDYRRKVLDLNAADGQEIIETGFIPDEEMPALYSLADIYVSPSLMEGFGLPLAEALACETPVVGARVGAVAEVVGPGGVLVEPQDPKAISDAVNRLLAEPKKRKELGEAGRSHIVNQFSVEKMVTDTLKAYEKFTG